MVKLCDDDFIPLSTNNAFRFFLCESILPASLHRVVHASIRPDVADAVEDLHGPFERYHGLLGFTGKEPLTEGFLFGHFKPPGAQPPTKHSTAKTFLLAVLCKNLTINSSTAKNHRVVGFSGRELKFFTGI